MSASLITADLLSRCLAREQWADPMDLAAHLLAELDRLERAGVITCRYRARRRLARLAPPELRHALHLLAGIELAGVAS